MARDRTSHRSADHLPDAGRADRDLTRRQREVLAALRRLTERSGHPPTLRELAADVGLASASTVHQHVRVLVERGHLDVTPGRPRTLVEPRR